MKNIFCHKKAFVSLAMLSLVFSIFYMHPVQAATPKIIPYTLLVDDVHSSDSINITNFPKNGKVVSVTSSNKDVIEVLTFRYGPKPKESINRYGLNPLKGGKSKITVKYKVGNTTKSISAVYTAKEWPNPFTYVKLNGKKTDTTNKYNRIGSVSGFKGSSATITWKLKKGWKTSSSYAYIMMSLKNSAQSKKVSIKSGQKLSIPSGHSAYVVINVKKNKLEGTDYQLSISR